MSKAFVKDDADTSQDLESALEELNPLPDGVTNYITAAGRKRFQAEVAAIESQLAQGPKPTESERLRRRQRFCARALQGAQVAGPERENPERVVFGTRVQVEDEEAALRTYEIVGVFEADPQSGRISWLSPLAKAFLGHKAGDEVVVHLPAGESVFSIVKIESLSGDADNS